MRVAWMFGLILALGSLRAVPVVLASEPLAEVNGDAISAEEVEKALGAQLSKLYEQIYTLRRQKLEALIRDRLLAQEAAKRGVSVQALLDAEVTSKVGLVTEHGASSGWRPSVPPGRAQRILDWSSMAP